MGTNVRGLSKLGWSRQGRVNDHFCQCVPFELMQIGISLRLDKES
jgi:hypothetical protein